MLNVEYICDKTLLSKEDELIPIILDMIKESYKSGLNTAEFNETMNLIGENQELRMTLYNKDRYINRLKTAKDKCGKKNGDMINQQKEFIKYLEGQIKTSTDVFRLIYKNILQKYEEIIGDDK